MKNVAVITGSASGIGREIVRELNKVHIDELWLIDKDMESLDNLQKEIPIPSKILQLELTDRKSYSIYEAVLKEEEPNIVFFSKLCRIWYFWRDNICTFGG